MTSSVRGAAAQALLSICVLVGLLVAAKGALADELDRLATAALHTLADASARSYTTERDRVLRNPKLAERAIELAGNAADWRLRFVGAYLQGHRDDPERYKALQARGPADPLGVRHHNWYRAVGSLGAQDLPFLLELTLKAPTGEGLPSDARSGLVRYARLDRGWPDGLRMTALLSARGVRPEDRLLAARVEANLARGESGARHLLALFKEERARLRLRLGPRADEPSTPVLRELLTALPSSAYEASPAFREELAEELERERAESILGARRLAFLLGELRVDAAVKHLAAVLDSKAKLATRYRAVRQLGRIRTSDAQEVLLDHVDVPTPTSDTRIAALRVLGEFRPTRRSLNLLSKIALEGGGERINARLVTLNGLGRYVRLIDEEDLTAWLRPGLTDIATRLGAIPFEPDTRLQRRVNEFLDLMRR